MSGMDDCDVGDEFLDVEVLRGEGFTQKVQRIRTISTRRLFDKMMEQLADEGAVCGGTVHSVIRDVARSFKLQRLAILRIHLAGSIDGLVVVHRPPASHGIKVLQGKAQAVDDRMAGHAVGILGQLHHLLTHGKGGIEFGILKSHSHRWRF